jgi:N-acyl homoserine lactone hydrolase
VADRPVIHSIEVHRLHLSDVTPAPNLLWARPTFPVFSFLVLHPAGPIMIDTGVGVGNEVIDEIYSPVHYDLAEALGRHGVSIDDVAVVITSHLHFDHCGQNHRFSRSRIIVQRTEVEAAKAPLYTVPEWAFSPMVELDMIDGDHQVAAGIRIISTGSHAWSPVGTHRGRQWEANDRVLPGVLGRHHLRVGRPRG